MDNFSINYNIGFGAKPIPKSVIDKTKKDLLDKNINRIDIYCHSSADEDTINSAKVFYNWLTKNGKDVKICVPKAEIEKLYFSTKDYNLKGCNNVIPDKSVVLDFNSKERLGASYTDLFNRNSHQNIIGYDHHTPSNMLKGNFYIDDSAKSCCGVLTRFFEGLGEKLSKNDRKNLYCGMISDYKKSGLLSLNRTENGYNLIKKDKLLKDKNSLEVFNKLDKSLDNKDKQEIYIHLDPLARLTSDEKILQEKLYSQLNVSPNGKMAYVIIPPNDKLWKKVGMDTPTTSEILKDIRTQVSTDSQKAEFLSDEQKLKMKDVNTVIAFYQKDNEYRMSIHSRSNSALKLIDYIKENINPNIIAGGHSDRAGGKVDSLKKEDVNNFINSFIKASDIL